MIQQFGSDMKSCMKSDRDTLLRKVRIIVNDPYATDDSSSDEGLELAKPTKVKRIVYLINLNSQLAERSQDCCNGVKSSRKKSHRQSKKPVGVRLRPSGKWAAEITNPITKTKKWLGTCKTSEEAEKAYAEKKVEYDTLASPSPVVSSVNDLSKENMCLNKDGSASGDSSKEVFFNFDFSDLQIPELSFLAAEEDSMVSGVNGSELDLDCLLMDDNSGHLLDELPDCDFTDVELELSDLKFALVDQLATPLNISCP